MIFSMVLDKARQRASVKWILSKAYNNRVPEDLREPFYRDHEGQDHLKPKVRSILQYFFQMHRIYCFGTILPASSRYTMSKIVNSFRAFFFLNFVFVYRLWKDWEMHRYTAKRCQIFTQIRTTKI